MLSWPHKLQKGTVRNMCEINSSFFFEVWEILELVCDLLYLISILSAAEFPCILHLFKYL